MRTRLSSFPVSNNWNRTGCDMSDVSSTAKPFLLICFTVRNSLSLLDFQIILRYSWPDELVWTNPERRISCFAIICLNQVFKVDSLILVGTLISIQLQYARGVIAVSVSMPICVAEHLTIFSTSNHLDTNKGLDRASF